MQLFCKYIIGIYNYQLKTLQQMRLGKLSCFL